MIYAFGFLISIAGCLCGAGGCGLAAERKAGVPLVAFGLLALVSLASAYTFAALAVPPV